MEQAEQAQEQTQQEQTQEVEVVNSGATSERAQLAWELHTKVVQAVGEINKRFYEVAALVKEIRDKGLYKELGYVSIQQYLSAIGAGLSYSQLRLGARIIEGILGNPKAKPLIEKLPERGIKIEEIPPSKLDDVLPAVKECLEEGQYDQATELIQMAQAPEKGGLSRADLSAALVERGFKPGKERRYLCLKGIGYATIKTTHDKESLLGKYDIIVEEPRFVKGAVLDVAPIADKTLESSVAEMLRELRALVDELQLAYINGEDTTEISQRIVELLGYEFEQDTSGTAAE